MDDKDKKIALRFFKETGFFNAWKLYTKTNNKAKTWSKVENITDMFIDTYFGYFLKKQYGIKLESQFGPMFKKYLSTVHKELCQINVDVNGIIVEKQTGRAVVLSHKL